MGKRKIFIVDDHPVFRYGLEQLINRELGLLVCGEAENAMDALRLIKKEKPDLVIVDIALKASNGLDLTQDIIAHKLNIPVLILSMYDETLYAERALRHGARGYIMKQNTYETLVTAIKCILAGGIYLSPEISENIISKIVSSNKNQEQKSVLADLTDREIEVLRLIGDGKSARDISGTLNLSINTINTYKERIKAKLNIKNHLELQKFAFHYFDKI